MSWADLAAVMAESAPIAGAMPVNPDRVLHLDGDMLAYSCSGNAEVSVESARGKLLMTAHELGRNTGSASIVVHLTAATSDKGQRPLVATTQAYQANRKGGAKPHNWHYLREYMRQYVGPEFKVKDWQDREADDGLGYVSRHVACKHHVLGYEDKDMRMLTGITHLDMNTQQLVNVPVDCYEMIHGGRVYGKKWFLLQMLQGDGADHIPGIGPSPNWVRGCGYKTAAKLLDGISDWDSGLEKLLWLYRDVHGPKYPARFAEQAMLLWIRTQAQTSVMEFFELHHLPGIVMDAAHTIAARVRAAAQELKDINDAVNREASRRAAS